MTDGNIIDNNYTLRTLVMSVYDWYCALNGTYKKAFKPLAVVISGSSEN